MAKIVVVCTTGVDSNTCRMKFIQRTETILTSPVMHYWIDWVASENAYW